jgi:betaine-aldehyde dehydrogenase
MGQRSTAISPSHGVLVSRSAKGGEAEAEAAIAAARAAFDDGRWSRACGQGPRRVLNRVADLIEANVERMALIETLESGKPITQARGEVSGAADLWRYAAALARTSMATATTALARTCWRGAEGTDRRRLDHHALEFPVLDPVAEAALRAGRGLHLRGETLGNDALDHGDAGRIADRGGLPAGVVNIVLGYGQPVGAMMASHPRWTW